MAAWQIAAVAAEDVEPGEDFAPVDYRDAFLRSFVMLNRQPEAALLRVVMPDLRIVRADRPYAGRPAFAMATPGTPKEPRFVLEHAGLYGLAARPVTASRGPRRKGTSREDARL
jgi:hypothetical protein